MKVSVIGTGYVGLVSGVCLAAKGHSVTCVDIREEIVRGIAEGKPHIHEKGLPELLRQVLDAGRFKTSKAELKTLTGSRIIMLAVDTPSNGGKIDLRQIEQATHYIGSYLRTTDESPSIVVKSTVIPGTTDTFVRKLIEETSGKKLGQFGLGMNPEFLREGMAVDDFMRPDRIILGHEDTETLRRLKELYRPWSCEMLAVTSREAEFVKYANNCLLATQISAVNELANIAAGIGNIDMVEVLKGVHLDRRWSPSLADGNRVRPGILDYLWPGCGFGGSCFPKDIQALRAKAAEVGVQADLLAAVFEINTRQRLRIVAILKEKLGALKGKKILVLGLAFKPGTDDIRESPGIEITNRLIVEGARLLVHDPVVEESAVNIALKCELVRDWQEAVATSDATVLITPWPEYNKLKQLAAEGKMKGKIFMDSRCHFLASDFPGVSYCSVGHI
uniref:UDP-glucose 6-dehydrogenase n=1 Tax=Candidatus Kentrum sp. DK TaxID=2126562 RepID=A0A450TBJ0_9GAMM|nr:MAG: UDPglucose 6-dehydrogenase/GDP-mannose 6-dehydrogenase [Candidatus Kentron sp. DK]